MSQVEKEEIEMSIIDHLDELRKKILICVGFTLVFSIVAYGYSDFILVLLKSPIDRVELVFLTPVEGFLTKINIAVFGGVVLASPVLFLQSLLFVSPALYKKEKIVLFAMLPFLIALFFGGIFFCFFYVLPGTLNYLMSFGGEHMKPMLSVGKYFSFVITLTMSLGIVFELPIVMLILSKFGIVNHQRLVKKRKYALLIIVIITAIITPTPDAITLLAVSVPLIMLFELSIWLIFVYEKVFSRKKLEDEANEKKAS